MLVLSRKKSQHILFPNLGIEVEVLRIAGNTVSLGINAPKSIQVLRGELRDVRLESTPVETPADSAFRSQITQSAPSGTVSRSTCPETAQARLSPSSRSHSREDAAKIEGSGNWCGQ